jgi:Domain of unknown function (DUF6484)
MSSAKAETNSSRIPLGDTAVAAEQSRSEIRGAVARGKLIGFKDDGRTPLVLYRDQPGTAAIPAAAIADLHGAHIGQQVILMFEDGDRSRPIIMGVLRIGPNWPLHEQPGQVEVVADGERLIISAKEQLILECGRASITLTRAGKVIIHGSYISSRSSGLMRIKGGSIQLN